MGKTNSAFKAKVGLNAKFSAIKSNKYNSMPGKKPMKAGKRCPTCGKAC